MKHLLSVIGMLFFSMAQSQSPAYRDIPGWVNISSYDEELAQDDEKDSFIYLLSDRQLHTARSNYFGRNVIKILSNEGVSQLSDLTFEFDPAYEELVIHYIRVVRDGVTINKLDKRAIKTVQRESNLERKLYDGRMTTIVNLSDVRKGDILDYAYSVIGENPIHKGGYSATVFFEFGIPFKKIHHRLITDPDNPFYFQYENGAPSPEVRTVQGFKEYIWDVKDAPSKFYDINTPSWYEDRARVLVSNYNSWKDVVNRYAPYYQVTKKERSALKKRSQELFSEQKDIEHSREDKISEIIDFVQDDIRYLGFEDGINSHKPDSPLNVLDQRFGDCKGKSLLLSELLNIVGVEAYPMLVSTSEGYGMEKKLPAAGRFDHCVVTYYDNGEQYFIDPTISNQGGEYTKTAFPDYKHGLVMRPDESMLTTIPYRNNYGLHVQEFYDLDSINGGATFNVVTTYKGTDADRMRSSFEQNSLASLQEEYLRFYSNLYPGISVKEPLEIEDDPNTRNEFTLRESYQIKDLWEASPETEGLRYVEFFPLMLDEYVNLTSSPERSAPYYVSYPVDMTYDISVDLPEDWNLETTSYKKESPYYSYEQAVDFFERKLLITHTYKRHKDYVKASDVKDFLAEHDEIKADLSYYITYDMKTAGMIEQGGISYIAVFISLLFLALAIFFALRIYQQYDTSPSSDAYPGKAIGGWLIVVAIALFISFFVSIVQLFAENGYWDAPALSVLWNTEGLQGKPLVLLIFVELFYNIVRLVFIILLIVLFFEKRTVFPKLMIVLYAVTFIFNVLDVGAAYSLVGDELTEQDDVDNFKTIFGDILRACIWIPYFLISKRVKNTFVHRGPNHRRPIDTADIVPGE